MSETFIHLPRNLQIRVLCKLASRDHVRLLGSSLITVPNNFRYELVDVCRKLDLNDNRSSVTVIVKNQPRLFLFVHFKGVPCSQLTLMVDMLNISSSVIHNTSSANWYRRAQPTAIQQFNAWFNNRSPPVKFVKRLYWSKAVAGY